MIEMQGICKAFNSVQVLKDVHFSVKKGEIHALMGENGAGKSTLMKILTGIYERDAGTVKVNGQEVHFQHPQEAEAAGIAVIHQELNILPELSVAENLFLGKEMTVGKTPWMKTKQMENLAEKQLHELGLDVSPKRIAGTLSVGQQQIVEIAKALMTNAELIVMDEPTAALTDREIETLFHVIGRLQKQGVAFIYISHRMEEIFSLCQRITVLRDGKYVGTKNITETNYDEIVKMMVGRELGNRFPAETGSGRSEKLRVERLSRKGEFEDVSFSVKSGEILGVAGLMGSGRTEVMETLFGYRRAEMGRIYIDGKHVHISDPTKAMDLGIGFITEDRKQKGLVTHFSIQDNLNMCNLLSLSKWGWMDPAKERRLYADMVDRLSIRTSGPDQLAKSLSGGNQQKVVIAKWLGIQPKILILDEPTRGVDVGAKTEIYNIINELAQKGVAVIMVSSELPEIIGLSNRVLVMHEGKVGGILEKDQIDQEAIMNVATGGIAHV